MVLDTLRHSSGWKASLVRYSVVALLTTGFHYGVYLLLNFVVNPHVSYTLSYILEVVLNYLLTSYFTFLSRPSTRSVGGYLLVRLMAYLIEIGLFSLFLWIGISKTFAPLPVFLCVGIFNFLSMYKVVFRKNRKTSSSPSSSPSISSSSSNKVDEH